MKAHHLIGRQHVADFRAQARFETDAFALRGHQFVGRPAHFRFVKAVVHNRAIQRLPRLPDAATEFDAFVFVADVNVADARVLVCRQAERLHDSGPEELLALIGFEFALTAEWRKTLAALSAQRAIPALSKLGIGFARAIYQLLFFRHSVRVFADFRARRHT